MRVSIVVDQFKIGVIKIKDGRDRGVDPHLRQRKRYAGELQARLVDMIRIQMSVAKCVNKVARLKTTNLRNHHREQRVRSDVERHPQKYVRRSLIELARQLSVGNIELKQQMAGRKGHLR